MISGQGGSSGRRVFNWHSGGFVKYSERPAEDGCLLVPPSGGVAGRTKASDREVTTGKNFKHPLALGGLRRLTALYRCVG